MIAASVLGIAFIVLGVVGFFVSIFAFFAWDTWRDGLRLLTSVLLTIVLWVSGIWFTYYAHKSGAY